LKDGGEIQKNKGKRAGGRDSTKPVGPAFTSLLLAINPGPKNWGGASAGGEPLPYTPDEKNRGGEVVTPVKWKDGASERTGLA